MKRYALLLIALFPVAFAQHNNRSARDLQFRFGNPGARSLGFGGAFIGLADDATAPLANPAGMMRTAKRSLSFELNYNRLDNEIPFQGGTILQTNIFEFDYQLETAEAPEQTWQVPYLAVVFPRGNMRYGFFAHQQANLERGYTTDPIILCNLASNFYPDCANDPRPESVSASTDLLALRMINVGGSIAFSVGKFSFGTSLFVSDLDYQADSTIVVPLILDEAVVERTARGQDTDFGGILGLLYNVTDALSLGLTYKYQPEFTYTASQVKSLPVPNTPDDFTLDAPFKVPDSIGFGVSINPADHVTINFDAVRVYYSQITDDLVDFTQAGTAQGSITQTMPDITEIHLGMEWIFLNMASPLSLRAGYWYEPYHAATNNVQDSQILEGSAADPVIRDIFFLNQFEHNESYYALGMGLVVGTNFQLDMAVELSESSRNGTVSGIYRF